VGLPTLSAGLPGLTRQKRKTDVKDMP